MTGQNPTVQTKTFIEYKDYELYETYQVIAEVPTRDVQKIDFKKIDLTLGFPTEFKFFDADVTVENGKQVMGAPRNISKDYRIADIVMSLDDYKKRELPKLAKFKKDQQGRLDAFMQEFLDRGLSLTRAFKAAIAPKQPVLQWYIWSVEKTISEAEKTGVTHIALRDDHTLAYPVLVTDNMIVLDSKLNQLHPSVSKSKPAGPRPAPAG